LTVGFSIVSHELALGAGVDQVSCAEGGNERLILRGFILLAVFDAILYQSVESLTLRGIPKSTAP
jgi:hypothetical protein